MLAVMLTRSCDSLAPITSSHSVCIVGALEGVRLGWESQRRDMGIHFNRRASVQQVLAVILATCIALHCTLCFSALDPRSK